MNENLPMAWPVILALASILLWRLGRAVRQRLQLSRAKHPALSGHARISRFLARRLPYYAYDPAAAFACDGSGPELAEQRRAAFFRLADQLNRQQARSAEAAARLRPLVSDLQFTDAYRVPFQFRQLVAENFHMAGFADCSEGVKLRDLDGNWSYDLAGSYGVNLLGYDFYKRCIAEGSRQAEQLGPVLGPYHPLVAENAAMLRQVSGLDEVSFHMSGTEAVMQAVRLARYHTRRSKLVMFCGAYHGWWDGVQPGVGNPGRVRDVFMLRDMHQNSLKVLRNRRDIACVLVNPLQALHPNSGASSDGMLVSSDRQAHFDRPAYTEWLQELRRVCSEREIPLIFDEVFLGFRLAVGGAQEYFGVKGDLVTYGKTVGGGLPVGVLCGKSALMKRFRDRWPLDICFARGTFNSHPYVMGSMNQFLQVACGPGFRQLVDQSHAVWNQRAADLNTRFEKSALPLRVVNMATVWTIIFTRPGRFNWLLQFYLRAAGLSLSWVGTGRLIFSLNYSAADFAAVHQAIVCAAESMRNDGWWTVSEDVSNRNIRRAVLRELLLAALRQGGGLRFGLLRAGPGSLPRSVDAVNSHLPVD